MTKTAPVELCNCLADFEATRRTFGELNLPVAVRPGNLENHCDIVLHDDEGLLLESKDRRHCFYRFSKPPCYLHFSKLSDGHYFLHSLFQTGWPDEEELVRLVRHLDKRGPKWASARASTMFGEIVFERFRRNQTEIAAAQFVSELVGLTAALEQAQTAAESPREERPEDKPN